MTFQELLLVSGMAVVTFLVRWPVLALVSRIPLPPIVLEGMKFIPSAVLAAILAPAMFLPDGTLDLRPTNAYWVAGLASALIGWYSRNLLTTIVVGMAFFLIWRWLW